MAKPYSVDFCERVFAAVERDGLSRREATSRFGVGISTAIAWVRRFRSSGSVAPGQMGGYKPKAIRGEHHAWLAERMRSPELTWENEPNSADIHFLAERIHEFNVETTGIRDGALFGVFLRGADRAVIGGAEGWMWGGTCYIRHLFIPAPLRNQGHGTTLMARIEAEAEARRCEQIVLETHDFQAPGFDRKLGFRSDASVEGCPRAATSASPS